MKPLEQCALVRRKRCDSPEEYGNCFVCPYEFECPRCHQAAGRPCKRPSGHYCEVHGGRLDLADAAFAERLNQQDIELAQGVLR